MTIESYKELLRSQYRNYIDLYNKVFSLEEELQFIEDGIKVYKSFNGEFEKDYGPVGVRQKNGAYVPVPSKRKRKWD